MLAWSVLTFFAIGIVTGTQTPSTRIKSRRDAFLKLVTGHGSKLPVLVLPVYVDSKDSDQEASSIDLLSLRNVKYSLVPQYVVSGNQDDRVRSRVRYLDVEPELAEDYDDSLDNNYPANQARRIIVRKKFVVKKSPQQNVRVSNWASTPSRGYIPVPEPTTTPSRDYLPVIDDVTNPSQRFQPPFNENIVPTTFSPDQKTYSIGDVVLNPPDHANDYLISITPPPKNTDTVTNAVSTIKYPEKNGDTSDGPKNESKTDRPNDQHPNINSDPSPVTTDRPGNQPNGQPNVQSPNTTSERPTQSPDPSDEKKHSSNTSSPREPLSNVTTDRPNDQYENPDRLKNPFNWIINIFNNQISSKNETTDVRTMPIISDSLNSTKGPENVTSTNKPDPMVTSSESPKTTTEGPLTTTEKLLTASSEKPTTKRPSTRRRNRREVDIPYADGRGHLFPTSAEMIKSYQKEKPYDPKLPAVMPNGREFPDRIPNVVENPFQLTSSGLPPDTPRFTQSMGLRIDVTVPRSDYTEAYDMQWHAKTNTARIMIEDGACMYFRMPLFDGRMQYMKFKVDTLNGTATGRCLMSPLVAASPNDHEFPGLPDLSQFQFIGYTSSDEHPLIEHWRHLVFGRPGSDGAAIGESLNYTHDFFLYRDRGVPTPIKYTVVVHSSVLGPYCDSYTHLYRVMPAPTAAMLPNRSKCQIIEHMKEPSIKPRQRGYTTDAPSKVTMPDDKTSDYNDSPILETDDNGNIAANINIGTGFGANLNREDVHANINIGAEGHVNTHRRIVANINIGSGINTHTGRRGIANLNYGADILNRQEGGANLNFGTRGIDTELSSDSRSGLANLNYMARRRNTGFALDKEGEDGYRNYGKGSRRNGIGLYRDDLERNRIFPKGGRRDEVDLDGEGVHRNRNFEKGSRRDGVDLDQEGVNKNKNLGKATHRINNKGNVNENIAVGKRGRGTSKGGSISEQYGNVNVRKGNRGSGVGLDRDVDESINIDNGGRGASQDLDNKGVEYRKGNTDFGEESDEDVEGNSNLDVGGRDTGTLLDEGKGDPNLSLEAEGNETDKLSEKRNVDETLSSEKDGLNTGDVKKEGINDNSTNDIGKPTSVGEYGISEADSAVKDQFNPMGDFLGPTKSTKYDDLFEQYKKKYKRKYKNDGEEAVRKAQFIKSLRYVEAANRIATNFELGINYMSDRLKDELRPLVSGVPLEPKTLSLDEIAPGAAPGQDPSEGRPPRIYEEKFMSNMTVANMVAAKDFPAKWDWREMGFDTPVRHQGDNCLSCSLMATTGAVEGLIYAKLTKTETLSPQAILDCGDKFSNKLKFCEATFPRDVFLYIKKKGLPDDKDYTYVKPILETVPSMEPPPHMCKDDVKTAVKIREYYHLPRYSGSHHLRLLLKTHSPAVVVFNVTIASSPQAYNKGVLDDTRWCKNAEARHSVVAVGYDFSDPKNESFHFKNSWGTGWGEGGYAQMKSGACEVFSDVSYPVL